MKMNEGKTYFSYISEYVSVQKDKTDIPYIYPHIHNYYEIYYNISGAKGYMVNGEFYKCNSRDLILIPPLCAHKVIIDKDFDHYERCCVNIDNNLLTVLGNVVGSDETSSWLSCDECKTTLTEKQHKEFMSLMYKYKEPEMQEHALGVLAEILIFVKSCFAGAAKLEYMDESSISHTDRMMIIIEKNFKTLTVSQIAELAHCNSDYLNRLFKAKLGITVKHYLLLRKLTEAQKYLCLGKSVKEACYLSGFGDYSNFLRTFKKYLGYTPGEFEGRKTF